MPLAAQMKESVNLKEHLRSENFSKSVYADSLKKKLVTKRNISAIFLSVGGGISVPLDSFRTSARVTFGILGRLEFASTSIFPFVIGAQVDYFSYNAPDEFKTIHLLTGYKTKILGLGLNIEYSLSKLLRSSFTMPFLTVDVKTNSIRREYDADDSTLAVPRSESKVSVGAGFGMTIFIFDFVVKYNYIKNNSFVGVYAKTKFPVIRF